MALLAVQKQGASLGLEADALVVRLGRDRLLTRPVHEVDSVHLYGDVALSPRARNTLLKQGVDVLLLTPKGKYLGRLESRLSGNAPRRVAQYRALVDPARALALAQVMVAGKLTNQRRLLRRVAREQAEARLAPAIAALRQLIARAPEAADLDTLRGLEGHGAAMYFRGLSAAVRRPELRFARRSRRPPRDPFNACLSFGYTLLLGRVESAVRSVGLDPYLGALHEAESGKPSLVLDLMEPFRPLAVDRMVLRLFNRGQLSSDDFVNPNVHPEQMSAPEAGPPPPPAVHLGPVARPVFIKAFAAVWRKRLRYERLGGTFALADILRHQAAELALHLEGDKEAFEPYTPR